MVTQICKTIADYPSANGAMAFFFSIRDCVPGAWEATTVGIFIILFFGNYFLVKSKTGRAKILIALLSSSIVTTILTLLLALGQLVVFKMVVFWAFMSIISFILLLISDNS